MRHVHDGESDLLIPDVVVATAGSGGGTYLDSTGVLLVVEVVSPSTRTTDTVPERAAYAERGIPAYLGVDPTTRTATWHGAATSLVWAVDASAAVFPG